MRKQETRPRWRTVVIATALMGLGSLSIPAPTVGAYRPTPLNSSLIRNAGAERGPHAYPEVAVPIPMWSAGKRFTVQPYGPPGQLPRREARRMGGEQQFFACGWRTTNAKLSQTVQLIGRRRMTDRGRLNVSLRVMIAAYGPDGDKGRAIVRFLDSSRELIAARYTRWVSNTGVRYEPSHLKARVPAGTRAIQLQLHGVRRKGLYCNAYFDNVRLQLSRR
jgi:hypothetical protein